MARRLARSLPLLVAATFVALPGCNTLSPAVTSSLVTALTAAAGQLVAPPKNTNQNLLPIFVKALSGQGPTADEVGKILQLCNGLFANKLPETPGRTQLNITTAASYSAFGILADSPLRIKGVEEKHKVGLGGVSPKKIEKFSLGSLALFDDAPILAAILGGNGQYKVLSAPDVIDLRPQMPPIRSQGQRGTCVLFATAGILDYMYANKSLPIKQASPQFMDWMYQLEVKTKVPDEQPFAWQDTGTVPDAFYPLLHIDGNQEVSDDAPYIPPQQGYLSEEACPYDPNLADAPPDSNLVNISRAHLGDSLEAKVAAKQGFASQGAYFFKVQMDAPSFESALAGGQPIQLGFPVYGSDWDKPDPNKNYVIPEMTEAKAADGENVGFHSVDIVGYERSSAAPGGGYFIIRNSWGSDWGDAGYCRVSYDTTLKYAHSPHVATPYAQTFNAQYDVVPPPKVAVPAAQALANRPLPATDQLSDTGTYTADDRKNGADFDTLFNQLVGDLAKSLGIKL